MEQKCQPIVEQVETVEEQMNDELPSGVELVKAKFVLSKDGLLRPSAVDLGPGSVADPTSGERVLVSTMMSIYMSSTSPLGNLKIWKVTKSTFIFSTQEPVPRYITAFQYRNSWYPVWLSGSDPSGVTEANMDEDSRVWEIFEKFSRYFIRLQRKKHLYLNAGENSLEMKDVGDNPDNTRNVTPLEVS